MMGVPPWFIDEDRLCGALWLYSSPDQAGTSINTKWTTSQAGATPIVLYLQQSVTCSPNEAWTVRYLRYFKIGYSCKHRVEFREWGWILVWMMGMISCCCLHCMFTKSDGSDEILRGSNIRTHSIMCTRVLGSSTTYKNTTQLYLSI